MIKTTLFAAALGLAALSTQAQAFSFPGWTGEIYGVDNCRSGTNYAHCASGQNHAEPARAGDRLHTVTPPPVIDPGDGCGDGSTPQGSVSLGGGVKGQGNPGSSMTSK